jgi:hypothetical protein
MLDSLTVLIFLLLVGAISNGSSATPPMPPS